jgi:hypothetical protein
MHECVAVDHHPEDRQNPDEKVKYKCGKSVGRAKLWSKKLEVKRNKKGDCIQCESIQEIFAERLWTGEEILIKEIRNHWNSPQITIFPANLENLPPIQLPDDIPFT